MEPFSSSVLKAPLSICYLPTNSSTGGCLQAAHARHLPTHPPRPSYALRRKPPTSESSGSVPVYAHAGASIHF
ncbi:hypothetical protein JTE90_027744 [Oedothorax gibbosus]|uniref:Uncharacterized protein n=1 Tax=Oedothorax gibbosus TaxID=931172 RepID=A0AAV6TDJ8_9ARAC|nr:hypothetical protein JTE90_027744 [Oedothorax gibbosus]